MKLGFYLPVHSLLGLTHFLRRQAPVSQEWKSVLSTEVSRNNAKLYSHKQQKKTHSPCCAGPRTAFLSGRGTIVYNLPAEREFQTAPWEWSLRCQRQAAPERGWKLSPAIWESEHNARLLTA